MMEGLPYSRKTCGRSCQSLSYEEKYHQIQERMIGIGWKNVSHYWEETQRLDQGMEMNLEKPNKLAN
jgi:hypothetical protein